MAMGNKKIHDIASKVTSRVAKGRAARPPRVTQRGVRPSIGQEVKVSGPKQIPNQPGR